MKKIKIPFTDKLPTNVRRATVLLVGGSLIILGVLLSILPGPFTIPLLLLGFAILASEFAWAEAVFQKSLDGAKSAGKFIKHPLVLSALLVVAVAVVMLAIKYEWYTYAYNYFNDFLN